MASRLISYNLRSMMGNIKGSGRSATYTTSTTPKLKPQAPAAADYSQTNQFQDSKKRPVKGEYVPVYVAIGMITVAVALGLHTVKQQLMNSPGVRVSKKTRETLPEVEDPDKVVDEAERFFKKSLFRKVAHVQDYDNAASQAVPDPIRKDAFAYKPRVETLKSVGVDPKQH